MRSSKYFRLCVAALGLLSFFISSTANAQAPELMLPRGHVQGISYIEVSHNDKYVLTTAYGGDLKIWDAFTGRLLRSVDISGEITSAHFSPLDTAVMIHSDGSVRVTFYNLTTGKSNILEFDRSVKDVIYSPNGSLYAMAMQDQTVWVIDNNNNSKKRIALFKGHGTQSSVLFSADSRKLIGFGDEGGTIWDINVHDSIMNIPIAENHRNGHQLDAPVTAAFSPDNVQAAVGCSDGDILLINTQNKAVTRLNKHTAKITAAVFSQDGKWLVSGAEDSIVNLWDIQKKAFAKLIDHHHGKISSIEFTKDGNFFLVKTSDGVARMYKVSGQLVLVFNKVGVSDGGAVFTKDGLRMMAPKGGNPSHLNVWEVKTGRLMNDFTGATDYIHDATWITEERFYVRYKDYALFWDVQGRFLGKIDFSPGEDVIVYKPETDRVITYGTDSTKSPNSLTLWKLGEVMPIKKIRDLKKLIRVSLNVGNDRFLTTGRDGEINLWSSENGKLIKSFEKGPSGFWVSFINSEGSRLYATYRDGVAIWDTETGHLIKTLTGNDFSGVKLISERNQIAVFFKNIVKVCDSDGNVVLSFTEPEKIRGRPISADSKYIALCEPKSTSIRNLSTGALVKSIRQEALDAYWSPDGKFLALTVGDTAHIFETQSWRRLYTVNNRSYIMGVVFSGDGSQFYTYLGENYFRYWDILTGKQVEESKDYPTLEGQRHKIELETNNDKLNFIDARNKKSLGTLIAIDTTGWVFLHPSGLFDASQSAMKKLYWVKGLEPIDFEQLKARYWQPGLMELVLNGKPVRDVADMAQLKMPPAVELKEGKKGVLNILITKRDGGYGRVAVYINNKEQVLDARPKEFDTLKIVQNIDVDIQRFLIPGIENEVRVKAWGSDGFVSSADKALAFTTEGGEKQENISFYAIICGVSDYTAPNLHLRFPLNDAKAIYKSISMGAENEFGKQNTHCYLLTSPGETVVTKTNLEKIFKEVKTQAKPQDVVLVYLSGHGLTWGGQSGDFYYLMSNATSNDAQVFDDPVIRGSQSVSSSELADWLKNISALKQVIIIDACGSGKFIDKVNAKLIDPEQSIALDRMKDKAGLYVISGCAADKRSYEASIYGHGLLTYSFLQGLKGAGLRQNIFADVNSLFSYSKETVPVLAQRINTSQVPQVYYPPQDSRSFDIGIIRDADKMNIPIAKPKPIFIQATLYDDVERSDVEDLSFAVNQRLYDVTSKGGNNVPFDYMDVNHFPDACNISGTYHKSGEKFDFNGSIRCGKNKSPIVLNSLTRQQLIDQLVNKAISNN